MKVLVVSPHPDDEAIGCGGAIRLHDRAGDVVTVVYITSGELGCSEEPPEQIGPMREVEAGVASQVLHTKAVWFWREVDGQVSATDKMVSRMSTLLQELQPERIYAPHLLDPHADHRATAEIVRSAIASAEYECYMYEIWKPIANIDLLLNITAVAGEKRAAIRAHRSQISRNGFDEAILALNHYRGLMDGSGMMYAEAFEKMQP